MTSKPEIEGKNLIDRLLERSLDKGGIYSEVTASQGMAKTAVLLTFTDLTRKNHPNEKIFWREQLDAPLQIFKLGEGKYHFLVMEGSGAVFRDRSNHLAEVTNLPITYFKSKEIVKTVLQGKKLVPVTEIIPDFQDLWDKSKPGVANVVFFGDEFFWLDFIHWLRNVGEWVNIFIDELADIAPAVCKGDLYHRILKFAGDMGAVRRCMMNAMTDTQTVQDVHWSVRKKVMMKIFLPGAIADKYSRVTQEAIDNLLKDNVNGNEAYLDFGGTFGRVQFRTIYKPNQLRHIECHILPKEDVDGGEETTPTTNDLC